MDEQTKQRIAFLQAEIERREQAGRNERIKALQAEIAAREQGLPVKPRADGSKDSAVQDFGQGVAQSALGLYLGAKDLFGKATPAQKQAFEELRANAAESGWGTAGRITGELAQLALPGAAAAKGAKALQAAGKATRMARRLPLAMDVGASMVQGGVMLPQEGEDRTLNAALSGAAAGAGALVGKALRPLSGKPLFETTPEAQALIKRGVYLTPGQAAKSPTVAGIESVMEVTPVLARGTKAARERGVKEWNAQVLKRAVPKAMREGVTGVGEAGFRQAKRLKNEGYKAAWGLADQLDPATIPTIRSQLAAAIDQFPVEDRGILRRLQDNIDKLSPDTNLKKLDDAFKKARKAAKGRFDLEETVTALRDTLRQGLPAPAQDALRVMDRAYPDYLTVRNAVAQARANEGVFTPKMLLNASRKVSGEEATAAGRARLQTMGKAGMKTVGKKTQGQPLEWLRRIASAVPSPPMQAPSRVIMAETAPQRAMAEALRRAGVDDWPQYIDWARLGAATEE